ncbi:MAG: DUF429 domain-containing protein [Chloroflexota bacterium]
MFFVGLDLSDPYAARSRPCTRAVLDGQLRCSFDEWDYDRRRRDILPAAVLPSVAVLAVDGPQGLASGPGRSLRCCECDLRTAGKSPYDLPAVGRPYAGLVRGSVELFWALVQSGDFSLHGLHGRGRVVLLEVYPGSAWPVLAGGKPLQKKALRQGREQRQAILAACGVQFPAGLSKDRVPTHDQLDAALAAYIAVRFREGRSASYGAPPFRDDEAGVIREGYIVQPL